MLKITSENHKTESSRHWYDRQSTDIDAMVSRLFKSRKSKLSLADSQKPIKTAETSSQQDSTVLTASNKARIYSLFRDIWIRENHQESLLHSVSAVVNLVRSFNVSLIAVDRLPVVLSSLDSSLVQGNCFLCRYGSTPDIWLDFNCIKRIAESASIPEKECLELTILHEFSHCVFLDEERAWNFCYHIWKQHGKATEQSYWALRQFALNSHNN